MGPRVFSIRLEPHQQVYYSGFPVSGFVTLILDKPMKMRAIYLKLVGESDVHWTESHTSGSGSSRTTTTRNYNNHEEYFKEKIVLQNLGGSLDDSAELPFGEYSYPFNYILPLRLPSSYEGAHGNVRYYLKAVIDKPWSFDKEVQEPFVVNAIIDLNQNPQALLGMNGENSKHSCCLCCAGGEITVHGILPKSGYVPGETLMLRIEVDNKSNNYLTVAAQLKQNVEFHATSKSKSESHTLLEQEAGKVSPNNSKHFQEVAFVIPGIPPTDIGGCKIISVNYKIDITVELPGCSSNLHQDLPIIIGTIPVAMNPAFT